MISNSSENISVDTMDNVTLNRRKDYKKSDIFVSVHIRNEHFPNLMEKKTTIGLVVTECPDLKVVSDFLKSF